MKEDLGSKKRPERRQSSNSSAQFTHCSGICEASVRMQVRNRIKVCGKVVTSNHVTCTWQAALLISEFVGSEVTKENF